MRRVGRKQRAGSIRLRIGSIRRLRYAGHIGYDVNKRYRGNRYAARACRLLLPLAGAHGLRAVWITCPPSNMASRRTCELVGGKYVETVRVPKDHDMYGDGIHRVRRYRIDLSKVESL